MCTAMVLYGALWPSSKGPLRAAQASPLNNLGVPGPALELEAIAAPLRGGTATAMALVMLANRARQPFWYTFVVPKVAPPCLRE